MSGDLDELLARYSRHAEFIGDELSDVQRVGAFGSQVIHLAAFAGNCSDIERIIEAKGDPQAIGDLGLSPLHYAVLGNSVEAVKLLASKGVDLELENEYGETPAQMANLMGRSDIERVLRDLGVMREFGTDGESLAKERWLEFESIQRENFWK